MLAVSFDAKGYGFCFGAACRETPEAAALSAANELAQAEVGLWLAETKEGDHGKARLSPADRLTLDLARKIDREGFLASPLVAKHALPELKSGPADFEIQSLGLYADCLHVATALAGREMAPQDMHATGAFYDLRLY